MASCKIKKERSAEWICRLCLMEREHFESIFGNDLHEWIENLTSLKIVNYANAPASLCLDCKTILKNFESFHEMCFTNDNVFKELYLKDDQTTVIDDISMEYEIKIDQNETPETDILVSSDLNAFNPTDPLVDRTGNAVEYQDIKIKTEKNVPDDEKLDDDTVEQKRSKKSRKINASRKKICPVCNTYVNALGTHLLTHREYQPFQCEYCSRTFNLMGNLKKHIQRHQQEKTHICNYCDKGFTNTAELKVHIRMHTNERPYKCNECGKSFKTSGDVSRHTRSHRGIRPHTCEVCHAKFMLAAHLKRHKLRHTMERPYCCNVCNKNYARPELLKAHKCYT